jgi:hypothetical protein
MSLEKGIRRKGKRRGSLVGAGEKKKTGDGKV